MQPITYTQYRDYLLPDIVLWDMPTEPLTKYGFMRRSYLKDHRPILYSRLALTEKLYPHLIDTQKAADERMETLMAQLVKRNPPPDKAVDSMAWVAHMNNLRHLTEEIILDELVYG